MRFGDLPHSARAYVAAVCGLALAQTALAALQPSAGAPFELFALLILAASIAHSFPVSTPGKQAYHVSLPFFVAGIILLAPLQLVTLVSVVHVAEWLRYRRRSINSQVFNIAAVALTGLVAQAIYRALWPGQSDLPADLSQPACLLAGLAAAATFAVLNRVLVSMAIWQGNRISPRNQRMFEAEGLLVDGVLLLMGVPLAHLALVAPWAAAVGAAPLWLIHRVLDLPNVRAQSRQDGLTELFTAPYLTETCTRELNRGRRFNRPVGLLLLDIDALGELNAVHGQQTGDAVLRGTARTISRALREYDLPARLAGGLFAVLLPETDLAQAQTVSERIRRAIAEQRHEVPGSVEQVRVTISIGGAVVNGQAATAAQLFDGARSALARAKQVGGNQTGFETVHAAMLAPVPGEPEPIRPMPPTTVARPPRRVSHRTLARLIRDHGQGAALAGLAGLGLSVCLVGAIAALDWGLLTVVLSLAAVAGFGFYFKSLPLALALASELNRSPARLVAARYWRMWPQYLSLGIAGLLVSFAYDRFGLTAAITVGLLVLAVRGMAGRYVDRTLESVRKLRSANEALEHRAFHDVLTNLPNRALFAERLEHAMLRAGEGSVAVLFLDLDNFKTVNDTLGHAAGDDLLVSATRRLIDCVRREDTIARLGGDEFTILLEQMRDPSDAARMAERIADALRQPFELKGQHVVISSSIGIALDTDRSHRPDDLLREADLAMYRAKSSGKARYEIFDTGMAERAMERLELETELRRALEQGELALRYRPLVSVDSDVVEALAAQVHWQHPRRGTLEPREFQRVAEEAGVSIDLARWALEQACREARQWQTIRPGLPVQLVLSSRQVEHPDLMSTVNSTLSSTGLQPASLRLEIAEGTLAQVDNATLRTLSQLHAAGVRLGVGDVGEGASSLARLTALPADLIRLHQDAASSPALVRATNALGTALGMTVTAEREVYGPPMAVESVLTQLSPHSRSLRVVA
jgi:diguanylate cyclase (GGDEF)-like protein